MAETKEVTVTSRECSSCCHPERSDCLRPLAGRICLSKIRFFAKEAQNDLSRFVGWVISRDMLPRDALSASGVNWISQRWPLSSA